MKVDQIVKWIVCKYHSNNHLLLFFSVAKMEPFLKKAKMEEMYSCQVWNQASVSHNKQELFTNCSTMEWTKVVICDVNEVSQMYIQNHESFESQLNYKTYIQLDFFFSSSQHGNCYQQSWILPNFQENHYIHGLQWQKISCNNQKPKTCL